MDKVVKYIPRGNKKSGRYDVTSGKEKLGILYEHQSDKELDEFLEAGGRDFAEADFNALLGKASRDNTEQPKVRSNNGSLS